MRWPKNIKISLDGPGKHIYLQCYDDAGYKYDGFHQRANIIIAFYDYPHWVRYYPLLPKDERFLIYERGLINEGVYERCMEIIYRAIRHTRNVMRVKQLKVELVFCKANTAKQILPLLKR